MFYIFYEFYEINLKKYKNKTFINYIDKPKNIYRIQGTYRTVLIRAGHQCRPSVLSICQPCRPHPVSILGTTGSMGALGRVFLDFLEKVFGNSF